MSEKRAGRGRGFRPNISKAPPPPGKEMVEKLLENAGNADDKDKAKESENKPSQTVVELKEAVKNMTVGTSTKLSSHKPLNPSAAEFTPSSTTLNPNSTEFNPRGLILPTKQLPLSTTLNPNSREFIPRPSLNIRASDFVPKAGLPMPLQNGDIGMGTDELGDREEIKNLIPQEEEVLVLEPQDIVERFERVAEVSAGDKDGSDELLKTIAEMLLKATMYPGSFEKLKVNVATTLQEWPPVRSTLENLSQMIIHWGISEPSLRYTACRVAQEVCTLLGDTALDFKKALFGRLRLWYVDWTKSAKAKDLTEDSKYHFINLSLFYAEMFVRVRTQDGTPFKPLATVILEYVRKLLDIKEDGTVICACHILKLTGVHLEKATDKSEAEMEQIISQLKRLAIDPALTDKTTDLVARVIQLQAGKWNKLGWSGVVPPSQTQVSGPLPTKLNTDAPVFIPSREIEFHYQQPVRNAEEWKEYFEGDDDTYVPVDQPDYGIEVDDDDGLDPEIELEMEAFLDEIEHDLMMRDFDPELDHTQQ